MSFTDVKRNTYRSLALGGILALAALSSLPSHAARPDIVWANGAPLEYRDPNFSGPTPLFSPDGTQFIFAAAGTQVFRTSDQKFLFSIPVRGDRLQSYDLKYTSDGKHIVIDRGGSPGGTVTVWSAVDGKKEKETVYHGYPWLSQDGRRLAHPLADPDLNAQAVDVRDVLTDESLLNVNSTDIYTLSPDSRYLVVKEKDGTVRLWSVDQQKSLATLPNSASDWIYFTPDSALLVMNYTDRIELRSVPDLTLIQTLPTAFNLTFSPNHQYLISEHSTGSEAGNVISRFWKLQNGQDVSNLPDRNDYARITFTPDSTVMIETAYDFGTRLLKSSDGSLIREHPGVYPVTVSPDSNILAVSRDPSNGTQTHPTISTEFYRISDGQRLDREEAHRTSLGPITVFSPDKQILATGQFGINLWNANDGTLLRTLTWEGREATKIEFSADGQRLITTHPDKVREWNVADGTLLKADDRSASLFGVYSPDGQIVAQQSETVQGAVDLVNATDGSLIRRLAVDKEYLTPVTFTADGSKLLVRHGSSTFAFKYWDVSTGTYLSTLSGYSAEGINLNTDGKLLVLNTSDPENTTASTVTVYDVEAAKVLWTETFDMTRPLVLTDVSQGVYLVQNPSTKTLELRTLDTQALLQTFHYEADDEVPQLLQFTGGRSYLIGYGKNHVTFWRMSDGAAVASYDQEIYGAQPISFSQDGTRMSYYESTGVLVVSASPITAIQTNLPGDLNSDGRVDVADAVRSLRLVTGIDTPSERDKTVGDLNGDRMLTVQDTVLILVKALGLPG